MANRLALGSVQFGMPYGIANRVGQVGAGEVAAILTRASQAGVDTIDTAIAYGESERRLGENGVAGYRLVTKLPAIPASSTDIVGWVRESAELSRHRLGIPKLHAILLHQPGDLLGPKGHALYRGLLALKEDGIADAIGVSIYSPGELDTLCGHFDFDLVQGPLNVFDRRLLDSGWLARLHSAGIAVHVRSVFLQGLLLMPNDERGRRFPQWHDVWSAWESWLSDHELTPQEACLAFALSHAEIDRVIVGVQSLDQLDQVLAGAARGPMVPPPIPRSADLDLIDPTRWLASGAQRRMDHHTLESQ